MLWYGAGNLKDCRIKDLAAARSQVRSQEDRQTETDHRVACRLRILCHFRQFAVGRERVQQQDPRATWVELQMCCASDTAQELRMVTRIRQISNLPDAASRALSHIEMVESKASFRCCGTAMVQQVQRLRVALAEKGFWGLARVAQESFWQRNTDVLSFFCTKLIRLGEIRLFNAVEHVTQRFQRRQIEVHGQIL